MENEKIFIIQFRFTRNSALLLLTALFLVYDAGFLGSEQLTLTTYYPAPYGGYVSLLTTGQTLLARDSLTVSPTSRVGIGVTAAPATKLQVNDTVGEGARIRLTGGTAPGIEFSNQDIRIAKSGSDMVLYTDDLERARASANQFSVGVNAANGANLRINGNGSTTGFIDNVCALRSYAAPGASCPAGMRIIATYGSLATCPSGQGMLLKDTGLDMTLSSSWTPAMAVNCSGQMLCCRIRTGL